MIIVNSQEISNDNGGFNVGADFFDDPNEYDTLTNQRNLLCISLRKNLEDLEFRNNVKVCCD